MASGQVHFKFMSARAYDSVSFDGGFVSVGELKRLIAARKSLSAEGAAELMLSDPETRAEYLNEGEMVPKNTSVLVKRAPAARAAARATGPPGLGGGIPGLDEPSGPPETSTEAPPDELFGGDLYSATPQEPIVAVDEEKAISELISGSASLWQKELASGRGRGRGRGRGGGRGGRDGGGRGDGGRGGRGDPHGGASNTPPPTYRCHRCEQPGHYISDCPTNGDPTFDVKRVRIPVGIPMTRLARDTEGGLMLPNGETGALLPNTSAFLKEMSMLPSMAKPNPPAPEPAEGRRDLSPTGGDDGKSQASAQQQALERLAQHQQQVAAAAAAAAAATSSPVIAGGGPPESTVPVPIHPLPSANNTPTTMNNTRIPTNEPPTTTDGGADEEKAEPKQGAEADGEAPHTAPFALDGRHIAPPPPPPKRAGGTQPGGSEQHAGPDAASPRSGPLPGPPPARPPQQVCAPSSSGGHCCPSPSPSLRSSQDMKLRPTWRRTSLRRRRAWAPACQSPSRPGSTRPRPGLASSPCTWFQCSPPRAAIKATRRW